MNRIFLAIAVLAVAAGSGRADDKDVVRIGIPRSVFRELPKAMISFAGQPFKDLIKDQSGLNGDIVHDADWTVVAEKLNSGKIDLGVFLGHEFAWIRVKHPDLEPLVISVPRPREMQAFVLVRHDSKAATLNDLKDAKLVLAEKVRDHVRLFLETRKTDELRKDAFNGTEKTETAHDAIHRVMDGDADVTAVDSASWSYFQKLYPGPCQNLKIIGQSEIFPATTIAYKKGSLDGAKLKSLRDGLTTAHQNSKGARMMNVIRIEKFDEVPKTYEDQLKAAAKAYPKPVVYK